MATTKTRKTPGEVKAAGELVYVVASRDLKIGDYTVPAGVEVPGAEDWPRLHVWVEARTIRALRSGETYIPYEVFTKRVDAERQERADAEAAAEVERIEAELAAEQETPELKE